MLIAWDAIRANKMRSVLTTLGIVIGIATVTLMGAAINGMNTAFRSSLSGMGADVLFVNRMNWIFDSDADWSSQYKRRNIAFQEARAVARQFQSAKSIAPVYET